MKKLYSLKRAIVPFSFLLITAFSACKKDKAKPDDKEVNPGGGGNGSGSGNTKQTPTTNRVELTNDSLFLYAKDMYYWNSSLPTYDVFEPRKYKTFSVNLDNYSSELFNITKYSGFETEAGSSHSKYSYIVDNKQSNSQQSFVAGGNANVDLNSIGYDMGFLTFQGYGINTDYFLYAVGVYPGSPAALAGLTRGTRITKINGSPIGTNYTAESVIVNQILSNSVTSATFSGVRPDGTTFDNVRLSVTKYTSSPVYKSKVIERGGKKIGYLAYGRFAVMTNPSGNNPSDTNLDPVFADFASAQVTDLVIDLRYNGGGSVMTSEYLANLIAPSSVTGVMYKEYYNSVMKSGSANILANQPLTDGTGAIIKNPTTGKNYTLADVSYAEDKNTYFFKKVGNLNSVKNIIFLVSGNTASASELLINNLKPHMGSVKLLGTTTYGKPVGFFPIVLENRYSAYIASFESKNSKDEGGYYSGMTPDIKDTNSGDLFDDATHDFGDPNESYLKRALNTLAPVAAFSAKVSTLESNKNVNNGALKALPLIKPAEKFNGMVEHRFNLKR